MPGFWSWQKRLLNLEVIGQFESWAAPVAKWVASDGFGESIWVEGITDTVVAVHLSGSMVTKSRGLKEGRTSGRGKSFALQPRGTPNEFSAPGRCTFAQILLSDSLMDRASEVAGQASLSGRLRPDLIFDDFPHLDGAVRHYVGRALDQLGPPSLLEMEGLALVVLDKLLAVHGEVRPAPPVRGGLAPRQLRRVMEFMRANQAQDFLMDDLAAIVDLSAKHFARAFRQSTGLPPHRYLMNQRLQTAREMLASSDLDLAEIALACGFADQSHFTAAFRKATGATPGAFRREQRR